MDFSLSEEQQLLKTSVERFLEDWDRHRPVSELWQSFAEMGWLAMPLPEEQGGYGGSIVDSCLLMQALGAARLRTPFWSSVLLGARLLAAAPASALRDELLHGILAGRLVVSLAFQEPGSTGLEGGFQCRALATENGFSLSGQKVLVDYPDADYLLVIAATDLANANLFVISAQDSGVQQQTLRMMDDRPTANLRFDKVMLPSEACLFPESGCAESLAEVLDEALIALAAEAQGAMDCLLRDTVDYVKNRKQFGVAIGSFQALQHRLVDMYTDAELCRAMLLRAQCTVLDHSDDRGQIISALKMLTGNKGRKLAEEAVQLHGGMGVSAEMPIGDHLKRLMCIDACLGNAGFHQQRFANLRYVAVAH